MRQREYERASRTPHCTTCGDLGGPERTVGQAVRIEDAHRATEHTQ